MDQTELLTWLSSYAYEPLMVYGMIILLLTASSFGLPVPEEVTLVSAGLLGYLAKNPENFPPPYPGAEPINVVTLSLVCFLAVILSDILVYSIGRFGGGKLLAHPRMQKYVTKEAFQKVVRWTTKYGAWMSGVFRFTPGLRFPGHMSCGLLGVPAWKFIAVDGTAALLTVPTQVWLVAHYGDIVLAYFKQFKFVILIIVLIALIIYFARRTTFVRSWFAR